MSQDYKKLAEKQIALGKPLAIIENSVELYFKQEDKKAFDLQLQTEYDALYKTKEIVEVKVLEDGTEVNEIVGFTHEDGCISLDDYKSESRVIAEAVEATYDENGLLLTERVEAVTEQVRPYIATVITEDIVNTKLIEFGYNYAHKRKLEYPAIEEQLDMQYKDSIDGGTRFKDSIEAVKAKYPKV